METVTVHQAKTQLSRLLAEVEAGREVVIARGTTPVAKLVALDPPSRTEKPKGRRQPGRLKGLVDLDDRFFEPLPEDELRLWEGADD